MTIFYPLTTDPGFVPSGVQGTWDVVGTPEEASLARAKGAGAQVAKTTPAKSAAAAQALLGYRMVTEPLAAQTISGGIELFLLSSEVSTAYNLTWAVHVYVTQGDTNAVRGTLLADHREALADEWGSVPTCRSVTATLGSVACLAGDRIVVEVGAYSPTTSSTSASSMYIGGAGSNATDGSLDTGSATHVDFSQNLLFAASTQVAADGFVALVRTSQVTGDALVELPTTTVAEVFATGLIIPPSEKTVALAADGFLLAQTVVEASGDGVVTSELSAMRYVKWDDTEWSVPSGWRMAAGERVDGSAFVGPQYALPYEFVPGFTSQCVGLMVCVDSGSVGGTGALAVTLAEEGTDVAIVVLDNSDWTALQTAATDHPGWLLLELETPVPLTSGTGYTLRTSQTGTGPTVLTTPSSVGAEGVTGRVLNCVVVSDEVPGSLDGRPAMVAPRILAGSVGARDVTVGGGAHAVDAVYLAPGATLRFAPGQDVTLTVTKLLHVAETASLLLTPTGSFGHRLVFGPTGGLTVYGALTLTGQTKTRYALLASATAQLDTSLSLTGGVTNWRAGDELYVAPSDPTEGTIVTVASVVGTTVTLTGPVGRVSAAGCHVVNLTRTAAVCGHSSAQRAGFALRASATVLLTHAQLARCGRTTLIAPDASVVFTVSDLVLADLRPSGTTEGGAAFRPCPDVEVAEVTIVRARWGAIVDQTMDHDGELLAFGISEPHGAVVVRSGEFRSDVVAGGINGGAVALRAGATFRGSVSNHHARVDGALVACLSGAAGEASLSGGTFTTVDPATASVLYLGAGGGLGKFSASGLAVDTPWVRAADGALFLGDARLVECTTDHTDLLVAGTAFFARLVDEDGTTPASDFVSAQLLPGSQVANRSRMVTAWGEHWFADDGVHLEAYQTTPSYELELGRIDVTGGETVTITFRTSGSGTVFLEGAVAPDQSLAFVDGSLTGHSLVTTATEAGVLVLGIRTADACFVDSVTRA